MRQLGLRGADGKRGGPRTTLRDPTRPSAPDLVDRASPAPSRTGSGSATSSTSRPGRASSSSPSSRTCSAAGSSAGRCATTSKPSSSSTRSAWPSALGVDAAGVVAHSDHGSQYTSLVYGAYAKQSGIDLSMGSIGDPWDNALAETFFASLEKELLRRERFATREHARMRLFWYIECFYNPRRRHSSLGMLSPIEYEQRHQQEAIAA